MYGCVKYSNGLTALYSFKNPDRETNFDSGRTKWKFFENTSVEVLMLDNNML